MARNCIRFCAFSDCLLIRTSVLELLLHAFLICFRDNGTTVKSCFLCIGIRFPFLAQICGRGKKNPVKRNGKKMLSSSDFDILQKKAKKKGRGNSNRFGREMFESQELHFIISHSLCFCSAK